uniref:tRNA A64-2'-O-ribosylphosphate transferase isoform X2 n=1 Tax=Elaeis guineensis var. tenera TaxID=51953 RepID=A0A6J0PH15_ELAGV|nr:tRNA A64-2'-O-ribosylphosphate transferase isoform X2 [Elaeis guineensis]
MAAEERLSIYRATRIIKKRENSRLYNALRSIYEDSIFIAEIAGLWRDLPLLANLRCGLWYSPRFEATCYFKSTDGHTNNWSFNTSRLNLHVAQLAGQRGGCIIVDSTRRGKRFPDSMSKTIPIWTCLLNRAVKNCLLRMSAESQRDGESSNCSPNETADVRLLSDDWDSSLHLPLWVPDIEKAAIEGHIEEWTKQLEACGADIHSLASIIRKPLRPLWISQKTLIWLNEVPDCNSWDFTPIILVSASASDGIAQQRSMSQFSWHYIPGAGDDEESWARGLSPNLFWKHTFELIDSGPDLCNQQVAELVEKERVYRAQRGEYSPQVTVKLHQKFSGNNHSNINGESINSRQLMGSKIFINSMNTTSSDERHPIFWLGSTNLAVAATLHVPDVLDDVDCVLNCNSKFKSFCLPCADSYLHLPMVTSKEDRFSLINNLPSAVGFAKLNLSRGKKMLVCCHNGEDISICVCLAILSSLFDEGGSFDGGKSFMHANITKWEMRRRLVLICKFAINARPSRGNLRQVFGFLSRKNESLFTAAPAVHGA